MRKIRAFIDLGTNTFHLLIAALEEQKFEIIYRTKVIVGLGAGGINEARITTDAMARGINCLKEFKASCDMHDVEEINAFGTSALRISGNSNEFITRAKNETGISIEVIDGNREAELIQLGISSAVKNVAEPYLIMDIGGGSTEFILVHYDKIVAKESFEVGVQRMISSFFNSDPIAKEDYENLRNYLDKFLGSLDRFKAHQPKMLLGASGTYTTLLRMYSEKNNLLDSADIKVPASFFKEMHTHLVHLPREKRLSLPGMSAPRVDLIVVGSCLVDHVLNFFAFDGFYVSENGLKEGALLLASKGKL